MDNLCNISGYHCIVKSSAEYELYISTVDFGGRFHGTAVQCVNSSNAHPCPFGHYCPTRFDMIPCAPGYFCRLGFSEPLACPFARLSCPFAAMENPKRPVVFFLLVLCCSFVLCIYRMYATKAQRRPKIHRGTNINNPRRKNSGQRGVKNTSR